MYLVDKKKRKKCDFPLIILGENLTDLNKLTTAVEKRQEYKTKSTPPSLEFSVRKPTPKIIEPKENQDQKDVKSKEAEIEEVASRLAESSIENNENNTNVSETKDKSEMPEEQQVEKVAADSVFRPETERASQSPERLLDSSTDSVPPSESSMESSQTYTSSLESSSHSPPLDESSVSSEKVMPEMGLFLIQILHSFFFFPLPYLLLKKIDRVSFFFNA